MKKFRKIKTFIPAPGTEEIFKRLSDVESRSMHGQLPIVWKKAKEFSIYDIAGNKWIDFTSTIFVTNISWFTFIAACFYGLKNFSFYNAILGIALSIILVHLAFARLTLFINNKFQNKNALIKIKTLIEYLILMTVGYFIFF